jgi:hypothetical protein
MPIEARGNQKTYVSRYLEMIEDHDDKLKNVDESDFDSLDRELLGDDHAEIKTSVPTRQV